MTAKLAKVRRKKTKAQKDARLAKVRGKEAKAQKDARLARECLERKWWKLYAREQAGEEIERDEYAGTSECALCVEYCEAGNAHKCPLGCKQGVFGPQCCREWRDAAFGRGSLPMVRRLEAIAGIAVEDSPARDVFEAEVRVAYSDTVYGKFVLKNTHLARVPLDGDLIPAGMPMNQRDSEALFVDDSRKWVTTCSVFDFATDAERARFENVKREKDREGKRFEGEVWQGSTVPPGMMLVYAGEYDYPSSTGTWIVDNGKACYIKWSGPTSAWGRNTILRLVPDPDYKPKRDCDACAHEFTPKPKFKAGDWVVGVSGEPFELNHPSLADAMNGDGAMVAVVRHASLSDFEKTVNGVKVLMQKRHNNLFVKVRMNDRDVPDAYPKDAEDLARSLGVTIAPAGLE